jgi:2-oxoisovalerate dehydrogenase E2 component (dihydrolipoyl transacylase)
MSVRQFLLPDLGEGLEDAEVVSWRVAEGDRVELNQTLVEVNTAKALVEIPAPWEGVVEELHAGEGDVVKVGQPLVSIRVERGAPSGAESPEGSEDAARTGMEEEAKEAKPKRQAVLVGYGVAEDEPTSRRRSRDPGADGQADGRPGPVPASPPVRRLARELRVDLAAVTGTGQGGRVTREDVMKAADAASAFDPAATAKEGARGLGVSSGPDDERVPVRGVRRLIAERMTRSAREIPHVTTFLTADATWLEAFRAELEAESGGKVTALPIIVRAVADVVREYRALNASFDADASEIVYRGDVHIGIATDTERGLLVPVVRHADRLGVRAIAEEIGRLVQDARNGRSAPGELTGSTVTVSNVGSFGADFGTPIINYPESAILAVGVIEPRPLVFDDVVEARPGVTLSLSFDHRVLDGAEAGRALKALGDLLESPFRLGALPR